MLKVGDSGIVVGIRCSVKGQGDVWMRVCEIDESDRPGRRASKELKGSM